jgi:hypothetical protein
MAHWAGVGGWSLVGACASVGIEQGKSTDRMLFEFLAGFHFRGHRAP